ncbi:FAD-dependent oxidoreductase [Flagellimonas sp. S3867]|uniref:FAD-dependent oxidoreductase n=1 Tax=Flagellimonas sp. S3867 TaxID=2768063 RepID=UPI0016848240|nr:FAD-dependent oxidoreductase [Flagellimonas sp. S3867]
MIKKGFEPIRENKLLRLKADLVVVGGGLAGVCTAVVAAREGVKVILVQDRPVLGGNASSEVRLWALGATSSMGNNNRWAREGGLINEILLDNLKRNRDGNPLIFDTVLLEKVHEESNIKLLLNTAVYEVQKSNEKTINSVKAFCSQNSTTYLLKAPYFCDSSGDGIVAFQAGASFRMGAETPEEFDEGFAPNIEDYGNLLGHSLYFYTKDLGKPVEFIAPSFAIDNAGELPRIRNYRLNEHGCNLWWVEYGGRLDTIHQSEEIKFELWKVVYGIWDYVKNSGKYPDAENLTLEWVGTIPGKRESRRFEGDYMLTQKDIVEQRDHYDRVAFGGWAMDLHPADGIYSEHNSCTQWHTKGIYSIPYRCYYSKDIQNLFLAGRIISASHVAFGSSRVMLTCAHGAQAVGKAVALCLKNKWTPRDLAAKDKIRLLQLALNREGQSIPRLNLSDLEDLTTKSKISASSELELTQIKESGDWKPLLFNMAQILPLQAKNIYRFRIKLRAADNTTITVALRTSSRETHFTPDVEIQSKTFDLIEGEQEITFISDEPITKDSYIYVCFMKNERVEIMLSDERFTGIMTVLQKENRHVSNYGRQEPPMEIGVDTFDFWTPEKMPAGKNIALTIEPAVQNFSSINIKNNDVRPTSDGYSNVWLAQLNDEHPQLTLSWTKKQKISMLQLFFDCDFDNALPSVFVTHPTSEIPYTIKEYRIYDDHKNLLYHKLDNYQAINKVIFDKPAITAELNIVFTKKNLNIPVGLFKISAYSENYL